MTLRRGGILLVAFLLLLPGGRSPHSQTATNQNPGASDTLKVGVSEVLLDIIATDKRGRQIKDLKAEEFEIYEDGVKQQITSLRQVEAEDSATGEPVAAPTGTLPAALDPLRQVRLVTLVFDQLGLEARQLAQRAALDFLETELKQNVFVAVFKIDLRLTILQQFTNNRELLRKAVELATTGTFNQFEIQSDAIQKTLERLSSAQTAADASAAPGNTSALGSSAAEAQMAEMQLTMLRYSETMTREQQGRSTIFSLMSLAKEQRQLPGRKTMIYFSEGIQVPSNVKPHWDALMSLSNRSNVSIYAVDARGLLSAREGLAGGVDLAGAAAQSQRQMATRGSGPVSRADVMIGEQAEEAIRKNVQNTLAELAENTGGFLIANTNDLRTGMRKVASEVSSYYALSYLPSNSSFDGKFRRVTVKVKRSGIKLQTRNGYFALPSTEGTPLLPFEMPMLSALDAKRLCETSPIATPRSSIPPRAKRARWSSTQKFRSQILPSVLRARLKSMKPAFLHSRSSRTNRGRSSKNSASFFRFEDPRTKRPIPRAVTFSFTERLSCLPVDTLWNPSCVTEFQKRCPSSVRC